MWRFSQRSMHAFAPFAGGAKFLASDLRPPTDAFATAFRRR
jgi:hypothetical protein